jgi:hypothetical protein
MMLLIITACLLLGGAGFANAETYRWTDEHGVIHFTDSPDSIPAKFRNKVKTGEDITIRNPKVQEELKQQEQRAVEDAARPHMSPTPDYVPAQQSIPQAAPSGTVSDELPPGRTKSQRIQDNIRQREQEDAGKSKSGSSGY